MTDLDSDIHFRRYARRNLIFVTGLSLLVVGLVILYSGGVTVLPVLALGLPCVVAGVGCVAWAERELRKQNFPSPNSQLEIEFESPTLTGTALSNSESNALNLSLAYREKLAALESLLRNAIPPREPDVNPDDVLLRLKDLDAETTTSVANDGAVTVVLRKKPRSMNETTFAG